MLSNSLYPHTGCFVVLVRVKTTNCLLVSKRKSSRFCIKLFRAALPCVFQPLYSLPQIFLSMTVSEALISQLPKQHKYFPVHFFQPLQVICSGLGVDVA